MPQAIDPNAAVLAARKRRISQARDESKRQEWFIDEVVSEVELHLHQRVSLATEFLRSKIVSNISRPVTKQLTTNSLGQTRIVVDESSRSRPGEFPKADTTNLMKSIFSVVDRNNLRGHVGTPTDYGLKLELKMQRSFLKRTLLEEKPKIVKMLTGPIR